jgi:GxxExxY protein
MFINFLVTDFSEIVYKDALEYEFTTNKIPFKREKEYIVRYKDIILKHNFFADFVVFDSIILEIKACKSLTEEFSKQTLNYLAITRLKLGLIINFGERSLTYKRIVL